MGQIIGQLQQTCCSKGEQKQLLIECTEQKNLDDDEYFNNQEWQGSNENLSPEKFIFSYQKYQQDQAKMLFYWSQVDLQQIRHGVIKRQKGEVLSMKWKYLIRKGTPCQYANIIILDLFKLTFLDCNSAYNASLQNLFKNKSTEQNFRNVPLFGLNELNEEDTEFESIQQTDQKLQLYLKVQVLNNHGLSSLIRLLWVIQKQYFQVEFNPMLIQIAALLLIYVNPSQAYCCLEFMIEDSQKISQDPNESQQLRWHIVLNQQQFLQLGQSFYDTIQDKSTSFRQIYLNFKRINLNYLELFSEMISSMLFTFIPFNLALKIFIMFMNEGIKIYYRFTYAIIRFLLTDLLHLNYAEAVKPLIRSKMLHLNLQQQEHLIKKAFSLRLNNQKTQIIPTPLSLCNQISKQKSKKISYYLPIPSDKSELVSNEDFEIIWDWLPSSYKLCDPLLIHSSSRDGSSMKSLLRNCGLHSKSAMLMLIQSEELVVFGFFCDQMLCLTQNLSNKFLGSNDSFVFILKPEILKFGWTGRNNNHIFCCEKYISVGADGEGPAIQLNENLTTGFTYRSDTYDNIRFNQDYKTKGNNLFKCLKMEVYVLQ